MADTAELFVTVVFGKLSTSISLSAQDPQALDTLKRTISEKFDLEPKFQRLLLRGHDVKTSTVLTDGCKLLLLRNQAYHEKSAARKQVERSTNSAPVLSQQLLHPGPQTVSTASEIDVNGLDDDVLLVQVYRGKIRYDMVILRSKRILDVKEKVSAVMGLSSPQALRLVVKGKTPSDDTVLETLSGSKKLIKSMVLLQEQQHVIQEKENDLRELLNELVRVDTTLQRVRKQMVRNFTSRDESLFELSRVLDDAQRIVGNLEQLKHHLAGAKANGPRATKETLAAITNAIKEANALTETTQKLLDSHSVG